MRLEGTRGRHSCLKLQPTANKLPPAEIAGQIVSFSTKRTCSLCSLSLALGREYVPDQEATQAQCLFHLRHASGNHTRKALGDISAVQCATGATPVSKRNTRVLIPTGDCWMPIKDWAPREGCAHHRSRVQLHIPQHWVTRGSLLTPNPTPAPGTVFLPYFCGREGLLKEEWWKATTKSIKHSSKATLCCPAEAVRYLEAATSLRRAH